ncbi:hypothetical protein H5410_049556 [Solanum commersonii]|uniref:Uncharacterized protein n=1 Tax=Solanum commersonii TaxID=4109 RepID=A0A9J5WSY4_SOLCO|nr:hypothetical protein H5410_049556 [Solanum commersonii]
MKLFCFGGCTQLEKLMIEATGDKTRYQCDQEGQWGVEEKENRYLEMQILLERKQKRRGVELKQLATTLVLISPADKVVQMPLPKFLAFLRNKSKKGSMKKLKLLTRKRNRKERWGRTHT